MGFPETKRSGFQLTVMFNNVSDLIHRLHSFAGLIMAHTLSMSLLRTFAPKSSHGQIFLKLWLQVEYDKIRLKTKKKPGVTELVLKVRRITDHSISRISSHSRRFWPDSLLSAYI